ncbi:MAG: FtsW/RodA/SpoVE family cell cycle protein [Armatimonadota bacterium]
MRPREGSPDAMVLVVYGVLALLGTFFMASASYASAARNLGTPYYFVLRHILFLAVSGAVFFFLCRFREPLWRAVGLPAFGLLLALNAWTAVYGVEANGARRWLKFGPVTLQPSEFLKVALVLALAFWLSSQAGNVRRFWPGFGVAMLMTLMAAAVVVAQSDLGTALVILGAGLTVIFCAGAHLRHVFLALAGMSAVVAVLIRVQPYRMERVYAWLEPWKHKSDEAYQVVQSFYAFGQGGWQGVGLGQGQAKYFIPAPHTDFVFATIAEETGILGPFFILMLFSLLALSGIRVARLAKSPFARMAAAGVVAFICGQALLNVAVVTGSVPCTGVPLPFISYGGSSLLAGAMAMALLFTLSRSVPARTQGASNEHRDYGRGDGGTHLSGPGRGIGAAGASSRSPAALRR